MIEETELFADCPGFDATLPHTFHAQPRGLTTLDVPVLILWGTLDVILLPRQGRRFERLIPGAELRYIRGIGHVPMSDAPEELAEAIARLRARPPAGAPDRSGRLGPVQAYTQGDSYCGDVDLDSELSR